MGEAVLAVWDPNEERVLELKVEWDRGPDRDARVKVPARFRDLWREVARQLRKEARENGTKIAPYDTLPVAVSPDQVASSATGALAIAFEIWGTGVGWKVPPPIPDVDSGVPPDAES